MIRLRTLGPVEVTVDGGPAPPELLWRKHLALLVYLVLSPRATRSRDHLIGLLWPDKAESAARHSLNEALRVLRRSVGDEVVETRVDQVLLHHGQITCDALELDQLVEAGEVERAAGLIAGEFMEGFTVPGAAEFENWLAAERLRVGRVAVAALVQVARRALDRGDALEADTLAGQARRLDPLSESAVTITLQTLALTGDRGRALALAEEYRSTLREAVGADPTPDLDRLIGRIRQGTQGTPAGTRLAPEAMARVESSRRRAPLIGRTEPLTGVMTLWSRVANRREPAMGLVLGHRGTGKTRFIEEVAARARLDGAVVLPVRAIPGDERAEEAGILAAAGSGLLEAPGLAGAPAEALGAFAGRLLDWQERFPLAKPAPEGAPGLGPALSEVIRVVADEVPVLITVDDAEHLDPVSLHGFCSLARAGGDRPVMVLMAADPEGGAQIDGLRARIGPDGSLAGLITRLEPLDGEALHQLIRWGLPDYEPQAVERLGRRLTADSAGLPLLAVELLSAVAGGMELEGGSWPAPFRTLDHTLPGDLPEPVVAAIRVGFGRLGPDARTVLAALSVMDPRATPGLLRLATGLDEPAVVAALDELEWSRWVVSEVRGYACMARIVRDVIARDMLTPGQRKRILARLGEGDPDSPTPPAARSGASPPGDGGTS